MGTAVGHTNCRIYLLPLYEQTAASGQPGPSTFIKMIMENGDFIRQSRQVILESRKGLEERSRLMARS